MNQLGLAARSRGRRDGSGGRGNHSGGRRRRRRSRADGFGRPGLTSSAPALSKRGGPSAFDREDGNDLGTDGLGSRSTPAQPTSTARAVETDGTAGDGNVVVVGVVPTLIGEALYRIWTISAMTTKIDMQARAHGIASPQLGRTSVRGVYKRYQTDADVRTEPDDRNSTATRLTAPGVQTKIGTAEPDDLIVPLGNLETGIGRVARNVVQRRPISERGPGRHAQTERRIACRMKLECRGSFHERAGRGEGGEQRDESYL